MIAAFVDELIKTGAHRALRKSASLGSMLGEYVEPGLDPKPDDPETWTRDSPPGRLQSGMLGPVVSSRYPIDREPRVPRGMTHHLYSVSMLPSAPPPDDKGPPQGGGPPRGTGRGR